jgi:hypothetical protein
MPEPQTLSIMRSRYINTIHTKPSQEIKSRTQNLLQIKVLTQNITGVTVLV